MIFDYEDSKTTENLSAEKVDNYVEGLGMILDDKDPITIAYLDSEKERDKNNDEETFGGLFSFRNDGDSIAAIYSGLNTYLTINIIIWAAALIFPGFTLYVLFSVVEVSVTILLLVLASGSGLAFKLIKLKNRDFISGDQAAVTDLPLTNYQIIANNNYAIFTISIILGVINLLLIIAAASILVYYGFNFF